MTPAEVRANNQALAELNLRRCVSLEQSDAFRWFLREAVQARMDALDRDIKNDSASSDERQKNVAKWNALKDVREFVDRHSASAGTALGHAAKEPLDISA